MVYRSLKQTSTLKKNKVITAVHLFLVDEINNKLLLARRCNTGYEDGKYSLIAGHVDENETIREAMIREAKEEAGIEIQLADIEVCQVMHRKREQQIYSDRIDFFIKVTKWTGTPKIMELDKCDDIKWFDMNNLPENTIPYIKAAIQAFKQTTAYSEFGWE